MRDFSPPETMETTIYRLLREAIVRLELQGGARLYPKQIAAELRVSEMPVRQALRRLDTEHLVVTLPRRGTLVAPLEIDEIEEIQAVRIGVEGVLAHYGGQALRPGGLVKLEAAYARAVEAFRARDLDAYLRTQGEFRDVCHRAASRPRLLTLAAEQRSRAERYIRFLFADVWALEESCSQQLALLEACRAGDGAAAEQVTRQALLWTLDSVTERLRTDATREAASHA